MELEEIFSDKRLNGVQADPDLEDARSAFERDFDRISFCSSFRRLQDKTQVIPFPESDFIHTRLTHSLEVSCVGRGLGKYVGNKMFRNDKKKIFDLSTIIAAACLAHDIGNPPFGHSGEDAISAYFIKNKNYIEELTPNQQEEFTNFEGNANGFRILTKLEKGLNLTYSTLAAFTKYPREAMPLPENLDKYQFHNIDPTKLKLQLQKYKKYGFFQSEKDEYDTIASHFNFNKENNFYYYQRHPLAYLVEAADDICYNIIDLEDAIKLNLIDFSDITSRQTVTFLDNIKNIIISKEVFNEDEFKKIQEEDKYQAFALLKAKFIKSLVKQTGECFCDKQNQNEILSGNFSGSLKDHLEKPIKTSFDFIEGKMKNNVYTHPKVIEVEIVGFEIINELLDIFIKSVENKLKNSNSKYYEKVYELIPHQFLGEDKKPHEDTYERLMNICNFVAGMTDTYATLLYRKLKGISYPIKI